LLFGAGCAGGSMWLDSALALPLPQAISGTLVAPVRALCEKVSFPRNPTLVLTPAQANSAESGAPRKHLARNAVSRMARQAPRRARPAAERLFGF
jgi:hypothetical protein